MTAKGGKIVMELPVVSEHQRSGAKLDRTQITNMITFAVAPPATQLKAIEEGIPWLNWQQDKLLTNYGLSIEEQPVLSKARILLPLGIRFSKDRVEQPGFRGRGDLRGKALAVPNLKGP